MTRLLKQIRKSIVHTLRWHRRIGLSVLLMVLLLIVTGILLNHSPGLNLAHKQLRANWLLDWYGIATPAPTAFAVKDHWLIQPGNDQLFFDQKLVANCEAPLTGAAGHRMLLLALCRDALLILDQTGDLVERYDSVQGLPSGLSRLQADDQQIYLGSDEDTYLLDIDSLATSAAAPPPQGWSRPAAIPAQLFDAVASQAELPGITLEKLLLDIHSGRVLGTFGVLLVDLVGIALAFLALSGAWAWFSKRQLRKSNAKTRS